MVTVVLCAHNQLPYTKLAIKSLIERTNQDFKMILVDSGSTDGTTEYFKEVQKERKDRDTVLTFSENINTVASYNEGIELLDTEYVAFLSNDQIVSHNWWKPIEELLKDKSIGLASCKMLSGELTLENAYGKTEELSKGWTGVGDVEYEANQPWSFRTELVREIGDFDPMYVYGWYMDFDYFNRVIVKGLRVVQTLESFTYHFGSVTLKTFMDKRHEWDEPNRNYFIKKWKDVPGDLWGRRYGNGVLKEG